VAAALLGELMASSERLIGRARDDLAGLDGGGLGRYCAR